MWKLIQYAVMLLFLMGSCSQSKKVDSPILGEYEFGFVEPERVSAADMVFNADGTITPMKDGAVIQDGQTLTYDFERDSLFILKCSFQGDIIETTFAVQPQTTDSILLKLKSKIRYVGADASAWIKPSTNQITLIEYDEKSDSTQVMAFLKKK